MHLMQVGTRSSGKVLGRVIGGLATFLIVLATVSLIEENKVRKDQAQSQEPQDGDGENVGAEVPSDAINDYVGTWMGGIQQGFATMPFKFQFNDDMTVTVWPADEPVVNTTYEIVEGGKFLALFNNGTEAFQGSASQGETGKFLDFCYLAGISKDSTGRMRFTDQMCGTAQKR